ncbi:diacylglycerol/lipid kinase family protein [Roseobacter sp. GAI101]|uniref:diacylglycerol/lipid kinase family protein n=1 Tax=Roseobacter sp. (strain GAI101) TaxID=391589 RepID=UPI0001871EAE|nr:diacylglycerol kinase family protein [Roseobacter sp. GAI101]EEB85079.1 diacylglycerol kinase, catalytic region [Roseobacter sp. GAI101]
MKPGRVVVILNKGSGRKDGQDRKSKITDRFDFHGIAVEFVEFEPGNDLEKIASDAASAAPDATIIASGGDGTICGVAAGLMHSDNQMGIIPAGTFNYFARSLNLPETVEEAVDIIAAGEIRQTNISVINDKVFLNNASIGAYPAILQTREGIYERWGRSRFAAYWSVVKALATLRAPLKLTVNVNGKSFKHRTPLVFAISNAFQLNQMGLSGEECIAEGGMVLLVAPDTNRWGLLKHAASLALGVAKKETDYEMHCGTEIDIEMARRSRPVARDGELAKMKGPFKLRMRREALNLVVPADLENSVR